MSCICMYICMYVCMYERTNVFVRVFYHERVFGCISASACANSRFRSANGVSNNSQQWGDKTTCEGSADSDTTESMPVASLSAASLLICALYHRVKNVNTSTSALQPPSYPSLDPYSFLVSTWKPCGRRLTLMFDVSRQTGVVPTLKASEGKNGIKMRPQDAVEENIGTCSISTSNRAMLGVMPSHGVTSHSPIFAMFTHALEMQLLSPSGTWLNSMAACRFVADIPVEVCGPIMESLFWHRCRFDRKNASWQSKDFTDRKESGVHTMEVRFGWVQSPATP